MTEAELVASYAGSRSRLMGVSANLVSRALVRPIIAPEPAKVILFKRRKKKERDFIFTQSYEPMSSVIRRPLAEANIIAEVANKHKMLVKKMMSASRSPASVWARNEVYYRLREELAYSFPVIGMIMQGRHHTTIMHGYEQFKKRFKGEEE